MIKCREHPNSIVEKWPDGYFHCSECPLRTALDKHGNWLYICDVCGKLTSYDQICSRCSWQVDENGDGEFDDLQFGSE